MSIRFGIMGLGHQGKNYANHLYKGRVKNSVLGAICSSNGLNEEKCKKDYVGVNFYSNYLEMLNSGSIDAVIITTPHYYHPELGIEALKSNIHLLIDKPVGVYSKQVRLLNEYAANKPDLSFGVMFNHRTKPLYQKVKSLVESGEIGEIRRTNWINTKNWRPQCYYDQSQWRGTWRGEGGGVLLNQAPHQIDLWQWICGMPTKVFSKVGFGYQRDINVEDEVTALVEYENGATGTFIACTHDLMGVDRFEIHGDSGKIIIEDSNILTFKKLFKPESDISNETTPEEVGQLVDTGKFKEVYTEEIMDYSKQTINTHCLLMENFANNILNKTPLIAPGIEGINQVTLSNGILLSAWDNKEISLPLDEEYYLSQLNKRIEEEQE